MKNKILFKVLPIIILFGFSCKQIDKQNENKNFFVGDSIISTDNYFPNLNYKNGYNILKKQREFYEKKYLNIEDNSGSKLQSDNIKFELEKQYIKGEKKYRIVLYTLINEQKKDSIEFYRNVDDLQNEPSNYTCLSYLDLKNKKVWQIKYFSSPVDKSVGFILYEKNKLMENGKIEAESLYYLDESLDIEMEKNKLYY